MCGKGLGPLYKYTLFKGDVKLVSDIRFKFKFFVIATSICLKILSILVFSGVS